MTPTLPQTQSLRSYHRAPVLGSRLSLHGVPCPLYRATVVRQPAAKSCRRAMQRPLSAYQETQPLIEATDAVEQVSCSSWIQQLQGTTRQQWLSFMELTRIHNYLPSCLLSLVGAWKAVGFSWMAFVQLRVWVMAFIAAGVATSSVVVNDYFDYVAGIDIINAPEKPLPSGNIRPDVALLVTLLLYVAVLVAGCMMEPPLLRWIIAYSALSTLLYTPLLKSLMLVKNFLVASVTCLTPISGALSAGMGLEGVSTVARASAFVFGAILFREILMDITDREGDEAAHVYTLPVVMGRPLALLIALGFLSVGCVFGASHFLDSPIFHFLSLSLPTTVVSSTVLSLYGLVVLPMLIAVWQIWRRDFDKTYLVAFIDRLILNIALGFLFIIVFD